MTNLRKLLKPGGYLLIGEGSSEGMVQYGAGFIFGTLPGWWAGVHEGRILSPLASVTHWDELLRRNGFSGIDTMSPPKLFETFGLTLMLSQAVDPKMEILRNPLSSPDNLTKNEVIMVGGQTAPVEGLIQEVKSIFLELGCQVVVFNRVEDIDVETVARVGASIISMADLDSPVFRDINQARWEKIKTMFQGEKSVLWLTKGRLEDEPFCNSTVGFGRVARHEEDKLRLQFMDIPEVGSIDAKRIAEGFVRLTIYQQEDEVILNKLEPEIVIDARGRETVPRLGHFTAANNRLNSTRRKITTDVDLRTAEVELLQDSDSCFLRQMTRYEIAEQSQGYVTSEYFRRRLTFLLLGPT
jgi:hypothetical protein